MFFRAFHEENISCTKFICILHNHFFFIKKKIFIYTFLFHLYHKKKLPYSGISKNNIYFAAKKNEKFISYFIFC